MSLVVVAGWCWCGWCGWRGGGGCPPPRLGRPSCAPPALSAVRVGAAGSLRGGGRAVAVGGGGGGCGGLPRFGLRPARSFRGDLSPAGCARGRKIAAGDVLNCYVFVKFLLRFCCVGCVILSCYVIISLLHLSLCHVVLSGSGCHRVMLLCQLFCIVLHPKTLNINS